MIICDICKGRVGDNHIQISIRGEQRHRLYDFGFESTYFEVCSAECGIELLKQTRILIPSVKANE